MPLPWVTLTQHDDDGDCPSIAAVAATTVFVQHRETSERDDRTRTENRIEKEERRTETRGKREGEERRTETMRKSEGEGETLAERKRHGRSEIQHRRRNARARARTSERACIRGVN